MSMKPTIALVLATVIRSPRRAAQWSPIPRRLHRPTTVFLTLVLASAAVGCAGQTVTPDATPTPSSSASAPSPTTTGQGPITTGPMTTEELAWLSAVEKLATQMDGIYAGVPTHLTPAVMAATAKELRGCSRELARIGSPSVRLQPVYVLVKNACQEYDNGATCLATAASIGVPQQGSTNDRKQNQAIECGFASSEKGGLPMAKAQAKGEEIKASTG